MVINKARLIQSARLKAARLINFQSLPDPLLRVRPLILLGTGVALCALLPAQAKAENECGVPPPSGGTVTCGAGTRDGGISYDPVNADLELVLEPGVIINNAGHGEYVLVFPPGQGFPIRVFVNYPATRDGIKIGSDTFGVNLALQGAVDTRIFTQGASQDSVVVESSDGRVTVALDEVLANSNRSRGIVASGLGTTTVSASEVTTIGFESPGIVAEEGKSLLAAPDAAGTKVTASLVSTSGSKSPAVVASSRNGDVFVDVDTVISGGSEDSAGILATAATGDVTIVSDVSVRTFGSARATAIEASSGRGGLVDISTNLVTTRGDFSKGISSGSTGDINVLSRTIDTAGILSPGMSIHTPGDVWITSGDVATAGIASPAILASGGSVTIVSTGTITTTGHRIERFTTTSSPGSHGIEVSSASGSVSVDVRSVVVSGEGAQAIRVGSAVHNNIIVRELAQSAEDFTIVAISGPATLNILAGGTVRGRLDFSDGADVVHNYGVFDAVGTSFFRDGNDRIENTGITRAVNGSAIFDSIDVFNSSGRIEMNDGAADDRLTIGGGFTGSGNSLLVSDVDFTPRTADVLVTGAATGSTMIEILTIGQNSGSLGAAPILLVDGAAGTLSSAFTLVGGSVSINPFVSYGLVFDPTEFDFLLANSPTQQVFDTAVFSEAIEHSFQPAADTVMAQLDVDRDRDGAERPFESLAGGGRLAVWGQLHRGERMRRSQQDFGSSAFDTSYHQDATGYQAGFGIHSDGLTLGLTGGVADSEVAFAASSNSLEMESRNVGVYGEFRSGGLFANALGQLGWIDAETFPAGGASSEFDATVKTLRGMIGYRADLGAVWFEPALSLAWTDLEVDPFTSAGATIELAEGSALRGTAGFRVGGDLAFGGGLLSPFFGAHAVEALEGRGASSLAFGSVIVLPQDQLDTFAQTTFGLAFQSGALELFVRAETEFGGDVEGHGGRAGLQLRF